MSAIELITKLREMTGAGIKDCNNALKEANKHLPLKEQTDPQNRVLLLLNSATTKNKVYLLN